MALFIDELKSLDIDTRNKVRAIIYSDLKVSIKVMNSLRRTLNGRALSKVEKVISSNSYSKGMLPSIFPDSPQLSNVYNRLCSVSLCKNLEKIDYLISCNLSKLTAFFEEVSFLNECILLNKISEADDCLKRIIDGYGYSNFILRKSVFLHLLDEDTPKSTAYIKYCGVRKSLINSLLYSYEEDQDYLSIKKSAINYGRDKSEYIKDMLRVIFLPIESDEDRFSDFLQSNLQSSLIDSIIILKVNSIFLDLNNYKSISGMFDLIEDSGAEFNKLIEFCQKFESPESILYHRSSAWLELKDVVNYRLLMDHFYEDGDSQYINLNEDIPSKISPIIRSKKIEDLLDGSPMFDFCSEFGAISNAGLLTRSAVFNFLMYRNDGKLVVSEKDFKLLMEKTTSLERILNVSNLKNLSLMSNSRYVDIIVYLLVIKRNENEVDNYMLREYIQDEVLNIYQGDVVDFVKGFSKNSESIGFYMYEVFNESFISVLSEVVKNSEDITNIRANLHRWMGDMLDDKSYHERAKNLLVDHRINLVRNQLDDHRIYVDTSKFIQWMQDQMSQELNTCLVLYSADSSESSDLQLKDLITKCFFEFYSNNVFGVASYLGRRLRHGTFKGFLYSEIVNELEKKYHNELLHSDFIKKWESFKSDLEKEVNAVVTNNLHIKSKNKREAFLDPNVVASNKMKVISLAIKNIREDFNVNSNTYNSFVLINEYCWRLAEIDMKASVQQLKNIRAKILSHDFIKKSRKTNLDHNFQKGFFKDLQFLINEKFNTIYGWFNKPHSVSPKASLGMLYKAVVLEVQGSYPDFKPDTKFSEEKDIEMFGGAYHHIYDALYVIVYNAAKHGKHLGKVERIFEFRSLDNEQYIFIKISSEVKDQDNESYISSRLKCDDKDVDNAQVNENRSGILKLYNLQKNDESFNILDIYCSNRKVVVELSYKLGAKI